MRGLLIFIAGLLAAGAAHADFDELARTPTPDWAQGALLLEVRAKVEPGSPLSPATRFLAERRIDEALPYLCIEALQDVPVDSYDRLADRLKSSGELFRSLSELAASGAVKETAAFSRDLHEVVVSYRLPFFGRNGLILPFVQHQQPLPMRRVLGFTPARTFTGLVILAQGDFPSHGKDLRERVRPALLPRLWDEDMNPVLSPEMCNPDSLKKWGVAAYAYSADEATLQAYAERVGLQPLRTMARGVFGRNATDILLSVEAARQLLSREPNRELLQEGRILIILDLDRPAKAAPQPER
jgi:hypothetical protein